MVFFVYHTNVRFRRTSLIDNVGIVFYRDLETKSLTSDLEYDRHLRQGMAITMTAGGRQRVRKSRERNGRSTRTS